MSDLHPRTFPSSEESDGVEVTQIDLARWDTTRPRVSMSRRYGAHRGFSIQVEERHSTYTDVEYEQEVLDQLYDVGFRLVSCETVRHGFLRLQTKRVYTLSRERTIWRWRHGSRQVDDWPDLSPDRDGYP